MKMIERKIVYADEWELLETDSGELYYYNEFTKEYLTEDEFENNLVV